MKYVYWESGKKPIKMQRKGKDWVHPTIGQVPSFYFSKMSVSDRVKCNVFEETTQRLDANKTYTKDPLLRDTEGGRAHQGYTETGFKNLTGLKKDKINKLRSYSESIKNGGFFALGKGWRSDTQSLSEYALLGVGFVSNPPEPSEEIIMYTINDHKATITYSQWAEFMQKLIGHTGNPLGHLTRCNKRYQIHENAINDLSNAEDIINYDWTEDEYWPNNPEVN